MTASLEQLEARATDAEKRLAAVECKLAGAVPLVGTMPHRTCMLSDNN